MAKAGWVFGILIAVAGSAYWLWPSSSPKQGGPGGMQGGMAIPVEATPATLGTIAQMLTLTGQVSAIHGAELKAEIPGRIIEVGATDGSTVSESAILYRLDDSVLRAQLAQARANLKLALDTAARNQRLLAAGAASQQEAESTAAQATLARANVQLAQANLDHTTIRAPFSGVVGIGQVTIGNYVSTGTTLTTLTDSSRVKILFRVPETNTTNIQPGTPVTIQLPSGTTTAPLTAIDGQVDPTTRTVQARIDIDNTETKLTPGQFIRIAIPTQQAENAVLVPDMSLVPQGNSNAIFIVKTDSSATTVASRTTITVGLRANNMAQITSGVQPGEMVVTAGQQKLQAPIMPVKTSTPTTITVAPSPIENLPDGNSQ